ncbi:MAG: alpha-amylase family glycosyl hydrolase [Bacteroidota bacterium]
MYNQQLHQQLNHILLNSKLDIRGKDNAFYTRFIANANSIKSLFDEIYGSELKANDSFISLINTIVVAYKNRSADLKAEDEKKQQEYAWFLSNKLAGMSLYVDRFCGNIKNLQTKLYYFQDLGVNLLHLMPVFESPAGESDGGYAVSNFRKVDERFGSIDDLGKLQKKLHDNGMYLMIDIVLNHTSQQHEWAIKAKSGDPYYQAFFYMYDDQDIPSQFEQTMPDIFPQAAPGNFTYIPECKKWAMTVFHNYQWDLNYTNPNVLLAMLDTIFYYANLGVDVLRIDAPAFIWKQIGTSCQNLPMAHNLLKLIKQCVSTATPGMALLGEAIVAPKFIMEYFGTGMYTARECDFAYNATHMAVQWDALATGDTRVMLAAQPGLLQKPFGTSWITYTRCHDDIGLGYDDYMIRHAGFDPYEHRSFIKNYFSGNYPGTPATGALFSFNPKTNDARISGSLASLCGLEKALKDKNETEKKLALARIIMMQAHSFFLGGLPMLFYGDEAAYTNDYSYLDDAGKSYDNRWMHRPLIDWKKNKKIDVAGTIEHAIFDATKKLLAIRSKLSMVADHSNLQWMQPHNNHIAGYVRSLGEKRLFCIYNFSGKNASLTWYAFKQFSNAPGKLLDHWSSKEFTVGDDNDFIELEPYGFYLLEPVHN